MKTALYFGSFNPVHIGHLAIANYIVEYSDADELWFVVSPQNPFKQKRSLLADYHRLELINIAIKDYPKFKASSVEFSMPKPSHTITTLTYLNEKYPTRDFFLVMGEDNIATFDKWRNYDLILKNYKIIVYPRMGYESDKFAKHPNVIRVNAPKIEISSSFIRKSISEGKDVRFFMHADVAKYVDEMNFYKKNLK